jgi:pyridinium-3,5-biscarboxylic acid mononucleotide sulfurtransferase
LLYSAGRVTDPLPILTTEAGPDADPSLLVSPPEVWGPKLEALRALFAQDGDWVVTFSGGIDSAFVLAVAVQERGEQIVALTAVSPTLPDEEREECERLATQLGARLVLVESDEMQVEGFFTNPKDRCFYCKQELYRVARTEAVRLGYTRVADGVNTDDLGDYRPGLIAADEAEVIHPLIEAGMDKADVRGAALHLGLDIWHKPAFACLSSRFPYGTHITPERLTMVGDVEMLLKRLGFRQYRVRYHDTICRIELRPADIPRAVQDEVREAIVGECLRVGFDYVALDLQGYRMGSLNKGVVPDAG